VTQSDMPGRSFGHRVALTLAFALVVIGMVNTLPEIPGLQDWARDITGSPWLRVSGFKTEFFFPPVFFLMMVIVVFDASVYRAWSKDKPQLKWLGLLLDLGLIIAAFLGAFGYMVEIDSICLIDQITGERARLIAEEAAREPLIPGISFEAEVPACQARFGVWILPLLFTIITLFFLYNVRVWGLPLVIVASVVVAYTVGTALIWVWGLSDNNFLLTKLGADGGDPLAAAVQKATNVFITPDGFMGRFMDIVINQVFPYVILGALFGTSAGGASLIKLAVRATRNLRGGPAHAAIVSSAMFGTITGGPVTNVLHQGDHGGVYPGHCILFLDLPRRHVSSPPRPGRSHATDPRRSGHGTAGLDQPDHHLRPDPDDPVSAFGQQRCGWLRGVGNGLWDRQLWCPNYCQFHGRCRLCRVVGRRCPDPAAVP